MPRTGPSTRIEEGIYEIPEGYRVTKFANGRQKERRFPPNATFTEMRDWRADIRKKLKGKAPEGPRGTFADDIRRYLPQVKHLVGYKSRRSELWAWSEALGPYFIRGRLDEPKAKTIVSGWLEAGVAPKTVKNRCAALSAFYHGLDGEDASVPTKHIEHHIPKRRPRTVTPETILAVEKNLALQEISKTGKAHGRLRDAKTRARFRVLAAHGMRPSALKRMEPGDLDLKRGIVLLPGTKDGEPVSWKLNADQRAAWQLFVNSDAWGDFDSRSYPRVLRTAGWPKDIRPYNVRHSIGQDLVEAGEDYEDVKDALGHRSVTTTKTFYAPTSNGRLARLSDRMEGRLTWAGPESGPECSGPTPPKPAQNGTKGQRAAVRKKGRSPKRTGRNR